MLTNYTVTPEGKNIFSPKVITASCGHVGGERTECDGKKMNWTAALICCSLRSKQQRSGGGGGKLKVGQMDL